MPADSKNSENVYDLIIVGSGIAGLTAALYAGRYRMQAMIIGEHFGGEGTTAGETKNYPGFLSIDGYEFMLKVKEQVVALGVPLVNEKVTSIAKQGHCYTVRAADKECVANTIVLALGSKRRTLGLPNEMEFKGKGVHYCSTCDGPLYRDKVVAVIGGGDASIKGLNLIARYAKKIYLVVRDKELTAEPINVEQMQKLGDKVETMLDNEVVSLAGSKRLEKITLKKPHQGVTELAVDGLFIEIGALPDTILAHNLGVTLDAQGYIMTDNFMRTNVDGIFAAGDTVNHFGHFKQYITAAALGAVAATGAYEDHKIHGDLCVIHALPPKM